LPPTFVPLQIDAFPHPAAVACAGHRRIVRVRSGGSLGSALEHARPGTTVLARAGRYVIANGQSDALDWRTRDVCLRAEGGRVVLQAVRGQTYGIVISAADAVLQGVTVRGFRSSVALDRGSRGVTLQGVHVESGGSGFRDGIVAYGSTDGLLVLNSSVRGADLGISCNEGPCAHWWVEHTTVVDRRRSADSGADAFAVESGRQIAVVDSTFAGSAADGIDTKATDVVVFGARVLDVGRNAIKLWHGGDVIDSVTDGSGGDAALVGDAAGRYRYLHVLVQRHAPRGNGYVGTWGYDHREGSFRIEIVDSIFSRDASGGFFAPAAANLSVRHTIVDDARDKLFDLSDGRSWNVSELHAFEQAGFGRDDLVGDPKLVAGGPRRWSPRRGSPAIDAAQPVPGLRRDLYGRPRRRGRAPDIGPVESGWASLEFRLTPVDGEK
jgi:hypothetical protein